MGVRHIYSCNFCREEGGELMGVYWMGVGELSPIDPRLASQSNNHLCKKCFSAIRAVIEAEVTWQKLDKSGGTA